MTNNTEDKDIAPQKQALFIDYQRYEKMLEDTHLDETQRRAFIEALWSIITAFVDLGFNVHPLQQVRENKDTNGACEYGQDLSSLVTGHVIDSKAHISKSQILHAASSSSEDCAERKES